MVLRVESAERDERLRAGDAFGASDAVDHVLEVIEVAYGRTAERRRLTRVSADSPAASMRWVALVSTTPPSPVAGKLVAGSIAIV